MLKKLFTFLVISTLIITAKAQTDETEIKKDFTAYFKTVEDKDIEQSFSYIYPKLFDFVPYDKMLKAMVDMFKDTTMTINMTNAVIKSISKPIEMDGIKYTLVNYTYKMQMIIKPSDSDIKEMNSADFTYDMMATEYGKKNVTYDKKNGSITANVTKVLYAINNPAYPGWKFLEKKDGTKALMEKLVPEKVLEKL